MVGEESTGQHHSQARDYNNGGGSQNARVEKQSSRRRLNIRRTATVYDAVAGKIGANGFLTAEQLRSGNGTPSTPAEVLLRRMNAPDHISFNYYDRDEGLSIKQELPSSDLINDLHAYVADFYNSANNLNDKYNFGSLDETALLAMGILLEEACKESLGETGDMVFTEPQSCDLRPATSKAFQYQIIGQVIPKLVQEYQSLSEEEPVLQDLPRKRQRRRYRSPNE